MKKIKLFAILIIAVVIASSAFVFAASRHDKTTAVARWNITIAEGQSLTKLVSCYDPDGDTPITMVEDPLAPIPTGATLGAVVAQPSTYVDAELGAAPTGSTWFTREFKWTPTYTQAGTYTFYLHATDPTGDDDWAKYTITVTNVNRPPVL
jgi:hypothetical protein